MIYTSNYDSPIGRIRLASKENQLIGAWIEGQKYDRAQIGESEEKDDEEILQKTKRWLMKYFRGEKPEITELALAPIGNEFRQLVWNLLCEIPYGQVTTYKKLAEEVAKRMKKESMSAQAIGGAVGHNPISIIIPCHRVIGTKGNLIGYAGGIERKEMLLQHEKTEFGIFRDEAKKIQFVENF